VYVIPYFEKDKKNTNRRNQKTNLHQTFLDKLLVKIVVWIRAIRVLLGGVTLGASFTPGNLPDLIT